MIPQEKYPQSQISVSENKRLFQGWLLKKITKITMAQPLYCIKNQYTTANLATLLALTFPFEQIIGMSQGIMSQKQFFKMSI